MKKWLAMLLAAVMLLSMTACGKSEAAKTVDDMIDAIGTVSLESETEITAAEDAYAALTQEQKDELDNYAILVAARSSYDKLVKESEEAARIEQLKQDAKAIDDKIDAIGTVSLTSGDVIATARSAFNTASEAVKEYVTKADVLTKAETELVRLQAANADTLIAAIGTVSLASKEAIDKAQEAYDALSSDAKKQVKNTATLDAAVAQLKSLRAADAQRLLASMTVDADAVRGINFYYPSAFPYYSHLGYWGADIRSFVLPYIGVQGDKVWLRMVCNYTADDWIFFDKITFAVDDERFTKTFSYFSVTRDNEAGDVWEYVDIDVGESELKILRAIANSTTTIVRFEGDDYYRDVTISDADKAAIKEAIAVYENLS